MTECRPGHWGTQAAAAVSHRMSCLV